MRAEDRLTALALLYVDGLDRVDKARTSDAAPVPVGGINAHDQVILVRRALLALLPPVVAACAAHDTTRSDCSECKMVLLGAQEHAVFVALARLGVRHPLFTRCGWIRLPGGRWSKPPASL